MRNNILIPGLLVFVLFNIHICKAQWIDNKINIYAGYQTGMFRGNKQVHDGNFVFPSLYGNMNNSNGMFTKISCNCHPFISYGLELTHLIASDWKYDSNQVYTGSEIRMNSMAPVIQLHSKFLQKGVFNRFRFFIELSPVIGISDFTSSRQLFNIQSSVDSISAPKKSNDVFYGFKGNAGIEWAFSQSTSLMISYSLQHNWVESILYSDTHFTVSQLKIGLLFKLMKDERFLYRN